ncbi:unnamed protein product [Knipowitschia caucasica]|uniref:TGF-beta family profile domain-containing protein n=1 Tax=Knipowitschia caucasica TaxID=637954 RepID=A0AAV2LA03_KNICA
MCTEEELQKEELQEVVKQHLLSLLHLLSPPNITHAPPRAALRSALRRVHAELQPDGRVQLTPEPTPHTYDIISFSERDHMTLSPSAMFFLVSEGNHSLSVTQASVWLYLRVAPPPQAPAPHRVCVQLYQQGAGFSSGWSLSERCVRVRRSGWISVDVTASLQSVLRERERRLNVEVHCGGCEERGVWPELRGPAPSSPHSPFLLAHTRLPPLRQRRSLQCEEGEELCCRQHFFIDFRALGWSQWIIAPSGYQASYCRGRCPAHMYGAPGSASSFHTAVVNQYRLRGLGHALGSSDIKEPAPSCCVPTRLAPMSLLYFDDDFNIVKRDVDNMVVEECGCS